MLHHFKRADHRHNYSVWWYPLYLTFEGHATVDNRGEWIGEESLSGEQDNLSGWRHALGVAAMVPQLVFVLLAPIGLFRVHGDLPALNVLSAQARRLPFCLFVTTAVFVHTNKVQHVSKHPQFCLLCSPTEFCYLPIGADGPILYVVPCAFAPRRAKYKRR